MESVCDIPFFEQPTKWAPDPNRNDPFRDCIHLNAQICAKKWVLLNTYELGTLYYKLASTEHDF